MYIFAFEDRMVTLSQWRDVRSTLVADWFEEGTNYPNVSVCIANYPSQTPSCIFSIPSLVHLRDVEINVTHNTERLFPYGNLTRDLSFHGVTDGVVEISSAEDIPFFNGYYRNIHVSS
jgi:hypothetical protein